MGPHPATRNLNNRFVSDPSLRDGLGPPNLSSARSRLGNDLVDCPHFPPALHQANRLCWVSSVLFIQLRMLGEMGLILKPISSWIFSARARCWFTSCIVFFIGDRLVLPLCIDIIVLNSPLDLLWSLVGHKYNYLILSWIHSLFLLLFLIAWRVC